MKSLLGAPLPRKLEDGSAIPGVEGYVYVYFFDDGMKYVGQTVRSIAERHAKHCCGSQMVDSYIRTHEFSLAIIEIVPIEDLDHAEQFYIEYLHSMYPDGLNFMTGGNSNKKYSKESVEKRRTAIKKNWENPDFRAMHTGIHHPSYGKKASDETRRKLRESHMGKNVGDNHVRSRPVLKVNMHTGEVICRYASINLAVNDTEASQSKILDACNGKGYTAGGFIWIDDSEEGLARIPEIMKKIERKNKTTAKKVRWLNSKGEVLGIFESGVEASKISGYHKSTICNACKGKKKLKNGDRWEYVEEGGQ
ncbi:MAG: hypothetical protein IJX35_00145 [Candidatus Methanomethylophilaceae archaeon]|nr:hypothetical protein [Candidatus Methanomethylophilaceae archaeon]